MSSENNFDIKGNLHEHPLAELLIEISKFRFNGSLRVERETHKVIIYFDAGDVVFAVSNLRQHRFYEMLLRDETVTKEQLLTIPNFTSDFALSEHLVKNRVLTKPQIDSLFSRQIEKILTFVFDWQDGVWDFSPLVRVKGDLRFKIGSSKILIEYARKLPSAAIMRRFKSLKESFAGNFAMTAGADLLPHEAFLFSRFEKSPLSVEEISALSGMPEIETFKVLYSLWLGGFISRQDWNAAFNERKISAILSANFTLKKDGEPSPEQQNAPVNTQPETTSEAAENENETKPAAEISLENYLQRVKTVTNHYDFLDVPTEATTAEIKKAYFGLAKRFHPDLFHKKSDPEIHQRVQDAFTQLANAYETLKNDNSREVYNYKMRKELEEKESSAEAGVEFDEGILHKQMRQATEDFNYGYNLLMDGNYEAALPFLTRAVYFDKDNPRYHAYFGKALSFDKSQYHKAESAMQTAIKLDAENADFRLILAEFFVQIGLLKRAEGELNRLLAIFPDSEEAQTLLDSLVKR